MQSNNNSSNESTDESLLFHHASVEVFIFLCPGTRMAADTAHEYHVDKSNCTDDCC